jgi:chromosome partitioning protein
MNILVVANQKGGTAKTTTAAALGVLLSRASVSTHLIDMDPQASLSSAFRQTDSEGALYGALRSQGPLPVAEVSENLTLSPSSIDLSCGETQFLAEPGREYLLKNCLERTKLSHDTTVIIDCPPSLGILALNCLAVGQCVLVVVQPGGFELRTLVHLNETVEIVRDRINPELSIVGAVLTNCHPRRLITDQVAEEVAHYWPVLGQVRADARILYATTAGKVYHLTRSNALSDYTDLLNNLQEALPWLEDRSTA